MSLFTDRKAAGEALAGKLSNYQDRHDVVVLALPRGGVPVAYEVAKALRAPLDVIIVRKLGVPGQEELAMGAIASGGARIMNAAIVRSLAIPNQQIEAVVAREQRELERREHAYRNGRPAVEISDKTVILIDDGIATGATMRAAVAALKQLKPNRIIVAVPTAAADSCAILRRETDEVVCLATPQPYIAVGRWYQDFCQTSDDEVRMLLRLAAEASQNKSVQN